jgi:hypothetical protein
MMKIAKSPMETFGLWHQGRSGGGLNVPSLAQMMGNERVLGFMMDDGRR